MTSFGVGKDGKVEVELVRAATLNMDGEKGSWYQLN